MHKKSIEAAEKLKEEDSDEEQNIDIEMNDKGADKASQQTPPQSDENPKDLRSESIASLRAKAQTYTAQIKENMCESDLPKRPLSANQPNSLVTAASKLRHETAASSSSASRESSAEIHSRYLSHSGFTTPNHIEVVDPCDTELLDPVK